MSSKMSNFLKILLSVILMLLAIYIIYNHYANKEVKQPDPNKGLIKENQHRKLINSYRKKYNNDEIVMLLEIPGVLKLPIAQTDDNKYYYTHDLYRDHKETGTPFLDYRNKSLNDKKVIIYDQKSTGGDIFATIEKYQDENYYLEHQIIKVYTEEKDKEYQIFSSYIEEQDFDFTNLNSYNGLTYYEHITKLKEKSIYDTSVDLTNNSKIIILDLTISGSDNKKDMLVIGVELPKENEQ